MKVFQTGRLLKGNFIKELKRAKDISNGQMARYMMGNGRTERKMDPECGKVLKDSHISDNGKMVKCKALEFLL